MRVDLSFADVVVSPNKIKFYGKREGTIRVDGTTKKVPAVKEGEIRLPLERFLEVLGNILANSITLVPKASERTEKLKETGENTGAENTEAMGQEISNRGEKAVNTGSPKEEEQMEDSEKEEDRIEVQGEEERGERSKTEVFRFKGRDGFSVLLFPVRNGVYFSIARRENNEIVEKSAGWVRPSRVLVLAEAIGASLHEGKLLRTLAGSILLAEKGEVSFMDGSAGTTLTGTQRRELFNLISAKFLGANGRLAFRAGRVSIREDGQGNFLLRMGRNEGRLSPGDLMILRSVCL